MFEYKDAFSRNIGWVTRDEQEKIRNTKVAIGGLGGAGGEHAITLARMGFENFHISDLDEFEVHNFNRQAGAFISTAGRPKCEVMAEMIKDINPNAKVKQFPSGLDEDNVAEFFEGVDIYVDGIDFFCLEARITVYKAAQERGIPNLLAAPMGMGAALVIFTKDSMSFQDYYRFDDVEDENEKYIKFLIGLSPALLQVPYLVDESAADFMARKGPSTPMAIKLCSGMLVSNVVKLALNRGDVVTAPRVLQFDGYRNKFVTSWCPFGTAGPIQRIKFKIAKSKVIK
jgi:molybdopterin/thiamine biosynthesis adenylyltransferase